MGVSLEETEFILVTNLIDGCNLHKAIFQKEILLEAHNKWSIAVDVAKALSYMYGRCIVHQDIKPSNVLVTKTYSAHVCDLGVARIQEKLATIRTSKGTGAGTIPYKAPEMFTSARRSTPVDMYSFGCLLI
ncbi:hypothetical protein EMCRGX_G027966 [Ephydatia muelleri]